MENKLNKTESKNFPSIKINNTKITAYPFLGLVHHVFFHDSKSKLAIISIHESDYEDYGISFRPSRYVKDVLELHFSDIDKSYLDCCKKEMDEGQLLLFTQNQAKQIVEFVKKNLYEVDEICVHCHAGVSRSIAVCAAISKYYTNDDKHWFDKGVPNMHVYSTLLYEFHGMNDNKEE